MAKFFATLAHGNTYTVGGAHFVKDKELEIDPDLYQYLENNKQFTRREEAESDDTSKGTDGAEKPAENPVTTSEKPLAKWRREDLEAEAKRLGIKGIANLNKEALVGAIEDERALLNESSEG